MFMLSFHFCECVCFFLFFAEVFFLYFFYIFATITATTAKVNLRRFHSNIVIFSSPCQRQGELLQSLGVRRLLIFHILIFSSETPQPNEPKLDRKYLQGIYGRSSIKIANFVPIR